MLAHPKPKDRASPVETAFRTIAAEPTVRGFQTKRGGRWYASTVQAVWEARRRYALT